MPLYLARAGTQVLVWGLGLTQRTTYPPDLVIVDDDQPVLMDVTTHDVFPAGMAGDVVFHSVDVTVRHGAGYSVGVTPIVDGEALGEQRFQSPPPVAGTEGLALCQAFVRARGTRLGARVRMLASTGHVELVQIEGTGVVLRDTP